MHLVLNLSLDSEAIGYILASFNMQIVTDFMAKMQLG